MRASLRTTIRFRGRRVSYVTGYEVGVILLQHEVATRSTPSSSKGFFCIPLKRAFFIVEKVEMSRGEI